MSESPAFELQGASADDFEALLALRLRAIISRAGNICRRQPHSRSSVASSEVQVCISAGCVVMPFT